MVILKHSFPLRLHFCFGRLVLRIWSLAKFWRFMLAVNKFEDVHRNQREKSFYHAISSVYELSLTVPKMVSNCRERGPDTRNRKFYGGLWEFHSKLLSPVCFFLEQSFMLDYKQCIWENIAATDLLSVTIH